MQRTLLALALIASVAGIGVACIAVRRQQQAVDRLDGLERAVAQHRNELNAADAERRAGDRFFRQWMRVQESAWVGDGNAPVQVRLVAEYDQVPASDPVRLLAEVRNASDHEVTVSAIVLEPWTMKLSRDGVAAKYVGPMKMMPPPGPVVLPPGRIMRTGVDLSPAYYAELKQPGAFAVEWTYASQSNSSAPKMTWTGALPPAKTTWRAF